MLVLRTTEIEIKKKNHYLLAKISSHEYKKLTFGKKRRFSEFYKVHNSLLGVRH